MPNPTGFGTLQAGGIDLFCKSLIEFIKKARIGNKTGETITNLSALQTFTIDFESIYPASIVEIAANQTFELTASGTVNILLLYNSSDQLVAEVDLDPVSKTSGTYYTVTEFSINILTKPIA